MKKTITMVALAIMALPATGLAAGEENPDTVKVINNPKQVVITQSDNQVLMNVKGSDARDDYNYDYRVTSRHGGRLTGMEREGAEVEFRIPFVKSRSDSLKRRQLQLFLSDVYVGFGGANVEAAGRDALKKTVSEVGVLNFVALGCQFNNRRSRLSLGVGFNWSHYRLNNNYFWTRGDDGVAGFVLSPDKCDKPRASLTLWSMQFPLLYNHSFGAKRRWSAAAGVVMNWNYYANFYNAYSDGKSDYSVTTRGLHQRKLSFDLVGMVSWHGIGAYVRYAPQSLFKTGYGPEIKNRWTVGLVLRGL